MRKLSKTGWACALYVGMLGAMAGCGGGGGGVDCSACANETDEQQCQDYYKGCKVSGPGARTLNGVCRSAAQSMCSGSSSADAGS